MSPPPGRLVRQIRRASLACPNDALTSKQLPAFGAIRMSCRRRGTSETTVRFSGATTFGGRLMVRKNVQNDDR
jgi:hypothetical protein